MASTTLECGSTFRKSSVQSDKELKSVLSADSISRTAYYFAFILYVSKCIIMRSSLIEYTDLIWSFIGEGAQVSALFLLILKFLLQRTSPRAWLVSFFVVGIGFVSWRCSHEGWLFWLALFVVCSEGVNVRGLAEITLAVTGFMTVAIIMCSSAGLIENLQFTRDGAVRQAMGFLHPNTLGFYLLLICVAFSSIRFGSSILPDIALVVITTAGNLAVAGSRSSALLAAFLLFMLSAFRLANEPRSQRILSCFCVAVVVAVLAGSYYLMVAYDPANPVHAALNSALSGRLRLANAYYRMQPLTLFGSDFSRFDPIYWESGRPYDFVVDNAFCHLLLRYGIVPTALFMAGLFALLAKLLRERRCGVLLFGITIMMVYGFSETMGIRVECDFFLVAMGSELLFGGSGAAANSLASTRYRQSTGLEASR